MKGISQGCVLIFAAAVLAGPSEFAVAATMQSFAAQSPSLIKQAACKYGSGKCPNVKAVATAPSTKKNELQDPTVDPDCKAYGSCDNGGPNGTPADIAAKKGTATKHPKITRIDGIAGESKDSTHKDDIHVESFKSGGSKSTGSGGGHTKGH